MTTSEVIETRNARVWLGDDGIVRCVMKPDTEETLDTAKENIAAFCKISGGQKGLQLVDISKSKSVSIEARAYYAGDEAAATLLACALIVGSPVSKVLGSFFIRFTTTKYPIKLFTSEVDAIEWLKGFLK